MLYQLDQQNELLSAVASRRPPARTFHRDLLLPTKRCLPMREDRAVTPGALGRLDFGVRHGRSQIASYTGRREDIISFAS
jgi:hypothetical protein